MYMFSGTIFYLIFLLLRNRRQIRWNVYWVMFFFCFKFVFYTFTAANIYVVRKTWTKNVSQFLSIALLCKLYSFLKDSTYYLILFTMYNTISASISLRTHQNVLDRFITHSSVFSYVYVQCYSLFHTYIVLLWSSKIKKPRCFIKRKE